MKKNILLLTIFTYNLAFAETFSFDQFAKYQDFDAMFMLTKQNDLSVKVKLDCQSYFHKVDILDSTNNILSENYISIGECEYLYNNFTRCIATEQIKCIDTDDIFNESCKCE